MTAAAALNASGTVDTGRGWEAELACERINMVLLEADTALVRALEHDRNRRVAYRGGGTVVLIRRVPLPIEGWK